MNLKISVWFLSWILDKWGIQFCRCTHICLLWSVTLFLYHLDRLRRGFVALQWVGESQAQRFGLLLQSRSVRAPETGRTFRKGDLWAKFCSEWFDHWNIAVSGGVWPGKRTTGFGGRWVWVPIPALLSLSVASGRWPNAAHLLAATATSPSAFAGRACLF